MIYTQETITPEIENLILESRNQITIDEIETVSVKEIKGKKYIHNDEDKPSITCKDGRLYYFKEGLIDRKYGPAIIYPNGMEDYFTSGELNKIIYPDGTYDEFYKGELLINSDNDSEDDGFYKPRY